MINLVNFTKEVNIFVFIFIGYAGLPLLDELMSFDERNPTEEERKEL
jgi:hypothetical protein